MIPDFIPDRMKHLDTHRGYAVPWVVFRDNKGEPQFTVNDASKHAECIARDLCPTCGTKLFRGRWFVGGPNNALHPRGAYIDPPMHDECAHYALRVCPYLVLSGYKTAIKNVGRRLPGVPLVDHTIDPDRPPVFVAVMAVAQEIVSAGGPSLAHVKPKHPYRKIEFWRLGQQLTDAEGMKFAEEFMSRKELERTEVAEPEPETPARYTPRRFREHRP